jgi:hypothetical protein
MRQEERLRKGSPRGRQHRLPHPPLAGLWLILQTSRQERLVWSIQLLPTTYPEQFPLQHAHRHQTSTISPSQLIQQGRGDHLQPGTLMGMGLGRYGSHQSPQGSTNFSAGSRRHSMLPTNCCRRRVSCSISMIVVQPISCRPERYRSVDRKSNELRAETQSSFLRWSSTVRKS